VAVELERVVRERGVPTSITVDNGSEFASRAMDAWAYRPPGLHSTRQARGERYIESFNGRLRDECLNVSLFFSLEDARRKLEHWRQDYNGTRPHSSLGDQAPEAFAAAWSRSASSDPELAPGPKSSQESSLERMQYPCLVFRNPPTERLAL
jgi:putative transposase